MGSIGDQDHLYRISRHTHVIDFDLKFVLISGGSRPDREGGPHSHISAPYIYDLTFLSPSSNLQVATLSTADIDDIGSIHNDPLRLRTREAVRIGDIGPSHDDRLRTLEQC
jgi:hypothetical protein